MARGKREPELLEGVVARLYGSQHAPGNARKTRATQMRRRSNDGLTTSIVPHAHRAVKQS